MSEDIFEALDEGENKADNGGDFADWWEPEQPGDRLVGVVVEMHSAPQEWTEAGEVPDTIHTVMSVGRGDLEAGEAATPKQHKQLKTGLEGVDLGDLVKLEFTGYEKVEGRGQPMNTYEVKVLPRNQWAELGGADDIEEMLEGYTGVEGDNRRTEPYGSGGGGGSSSSGGGGDAGVQADDSEIGQAASALRELVDIQGGEVEREQAERILTEIRGFDVDMDEAVLVAGLDEDDGVIS
jgi:hypothetical protein